MLVYHSCWYSYSRLLILYTDIIFQRKKYIIFPWLYITYTCYLEEINFINIIYWINKYYLLIVTLINCLILCVFFILYLWFNNIFIVFIFLPHRVGLMVGVSTSRAVGRGFVPRSGHTEDHHKNDTNCLPAWHAGVWQCSPAVLFVCGIVWVHALQISPWINHKIRVLYPGPRFLSSAT